PKTRARRRGSPRATRRNCATGDGAVRARRGGSGERACQLVNSTQTRSPCGIEGSSWGIEGSDSKKSVRAELVEALRACHQPFDAGLRQAQSLAQGERCCC